MRRLPLLAAAVAVPAAVALFAVRPAAAKPEPAAAAAAQLPIKQVVLFSSGVGFFGREAEIDGDATVELQFPTRDINDLLKSLTLRDLGQGTVDAVNYDSQAPIERTLQSFAIDLNGNPSLADLLTQARGERVEVQAPRADKSLESITGSIVSVERRPEVVKDHTVEVVTLNLLTADGLRAIPLATVAKLKFSNPALDAELKRALDVLATAKSAQKKAVSLRFRGQGKRPVRVGYVVEAPVWKTSYRLSMTSDGRPYLQGWAVVENPSDEDWSDVRMTLVSGRPVSFKMDLYQPLYVPRPTVVEERYASLKPPTYDGDMEGRNRAPVAMTPPAPPPAEPTSAGFGGAMGGFPARQGVNAPRPMAARAAKKEAEMLADDAAPIDRAERLAAVVQDKSSETLDLQRGVASAASAGQLGDSFQYQIQRPVSLPRQKSSLLPIVGQEVDGQRVSIFNAAVHAKFPLLGLRFKNTSALNLMQGPVTLFDGGTYAGDARLPDLQPNEERLLSYAIDLGTEMEVQQKRPPQRITAVKLVKGVLQVVTKQREEKLYRAVNRSALDRTLLVEHPFRAEYTLQDGAKPAERTRELYRFAVKLPAHGNGEQLVAEERELTRAIGIADMDEGTVRFYLLQAAPSPAVKKALEEALRWQARLAEVRRNVQGVGQQLAAIERDQQRLRENLKVTPDGTSARKRYLDKFDAQEPEIEKLQAEQRRLQAQESQLRGEYDRFIAGLSVE